MWFNRFNILIIFYFSLIPVLNLGQLSDTPLPGKPAADFTLMSTEGKNISLSDFKGNIVVLEWFNPECPFVKKHYNSQNMQTLQEKYTREGVIWLTISSSAEGKQGYCTRERGNEIIHERKIHSSAFLLDHDGRVGKLYDAKTTPHMFIIDQSGILVYNGAIDDKPSTKIDDINGAVNYIQKALDELLAGKNISIPLSQPYGCSVKYATN